ncbi:MAG: cyclic nucleotide-binding domain-containing protein, partial [Chloroflexi bacterium]|nr:cyclic nucleotide-binding domain-containing protein [Chloroflexota bacterium]
MTHSSQLIAHSSLFDGLTAEQLEAVVRQMKPRRFREGEVICRENEPGNSLFVIQDGLALVLVSQPASGSSEAVARLRRGDVVGEMSLVTGEPRSATVMAAVPTSVLELGQEDFAGILARYPAVLMNLNRILSRRLARTNVRQADRRRGEAVALVLGPRTGSAAPRLLAATRAASPRSVASLDVRPYSYAQTFSLGPTGDDRPD